MNKSILPLALSALSLSLFAANAAVDDSQGVVGGDPINISQAPYQVALINNSGQQFCGGTIIAKNWVVTAAHCLWGISPGRITVVAGKTHRSEFSNGLDVIEVHKYPGFYDTKNGKDIGLLKLGRDLDLSNPGIKAIGYATSNDAGAGLTEPGRLATLTGWGRLNYPGNYAEQLQSVNMHLASLEDALAIFKSHYGIHTLTPDQLPAWENGKSACHGDSGGPLVVPKGDSVILAGVVSWGKDCADIAPSMFARVSSFSSWIQGIVGNVDNTGNIPPTVYLSNPVEGQQFNQGDTIEITAMADDGDGVVSKVQFYQNNVLLSEDTQYPYSHQLQGAAVGNHTLTAVAFDDNAVSTTSTAVTIKVMGDNDTGCTGVAEWSASQVYARSGKNVGYKGNQYQNKWWTQGEQPDQSGQWGVWKLIGVCE
ncbi:MAG: trypsin-like serine protease [Algicola sp.]|nr:trypsin-like serine protease [Algicola sp.]